MNLGTNRIETYHSYVLAVQHLSQQQSISPSTKITSLTVTEE